MLIAALILSSIVLAAANLAAACRASPRSAIVVSSLCVMLLGCLGGALFPPVFIQLLCLLVVCTIWQSSGRSAWWFLASSIVTTVAAFGVASILSISSMNEYARLRDKFPFESMEMRLPTPRLELRTAALPSHVAVRFKDLEDHIAESRNYNGFLLKELHENTVALFIDSPGFGVGRIFRPSEGRLTRNLREEPAPKQPTSVAFSTWSPGNMSPKLEAPDESKLHDLHRMSLEDFLYPEGWGYFKDRRQVAGFQPHRFSAVPDGVRWKVETLDLVSLLLHDDPAVYVSERLPQMDKVHDVPTRPLDTFESFGLESLMQGEDLFFGETSDGLRMLGAVRSVKQCLDCHGGERGDLLGAFSYSLKHGETE
jgi:hypothetical protein